LKTVLALIRKEIRLFLNDRVAVSFAFVIPIVLILLWGSIFGNIDSGPQHLNLAFLNQSTSRIATRIERVLDTTRTFSLTRTYQDERGTDIPFDTSSIKDYVRRGHAAAALVIPADAYTDTSIGLHLKFYYDPRNDMETQIIQGILQQTIMTQVPEVFMESSKRSALRYLGNDTGRAFNSDIARTVGKYFHVDFEKLLTFRLNDTSSLFPPGGDSSRTGAKDFFGNILKLDKEQLVGKEVPNPWAARSVGGWAMMFLLFVLNGAASNLFEEKQTGVVLRVLAAPVTRVQLLWSKYLFHIILGLFQLVVLFVAGALLMKVDVLSNVYNLLLVMIAAATACSAFGMLLAAVCSTPGQARGLGTLLILAMSSIGGAWFPTSFMPPLIQTLSRASLVYWAMDGFLQVLWRGASTLDILPDVGVLMGMALVATLVSIWRFRRGHVL
jgi:ABC-2 type transport system permease protein